MPDQAFQQTPLYPLEKPLVDDLNQDSSQTLRSIRDTMYALLAGASGLIGGGLQVVQQSPAALGVVIKAGLGWQDAPTDTPSSIGGLAGLNDLSRYKPIVLAQDYSIAVPTPPGSNSRIDLIEVRYNRQLDNSQSRNFLDTSSGAFAPSNVAKTLDFSVDGTLGYYAATDVPTTALAYKSGVTSASPVAPTTDTGYMPLAWITVASGVTTIVTANITDERNVITQLTAIPTSGRFLRRVIFTTGGAFTYTPGALASTINVQMVGGGGGGGGCAAGAGPATTVGGGGASGMYLTFRAPAIAGSGAVGTSGSGGAAGNNAGNDGADTTLTFGVTTFTAKGGGGGRGGPNSGSGTIIIQGGTIPTGSSSSAFIFNSGDDGSPGIGSTDLGSLNGGKGGSNPLGSGGSGAINGPGLGGLGRGCGGGGASDLSGTAHAGGDGVSGCVIIDEYS